MRTPAKRPVKKAPAPVRTKNGLEDPKTWSTHLPAFARLTTKEKIALFKYLAVMSNAGIPLERALEAVHGQTKSLVMHRVLHLMITDVTSGEFLSTSLRKMPKIFDGMLVGLVEAGENSGTLSASLFRIAENLDKARELRAKVQGALLYPLIILFATSGITAYLMFFLLPQITPLFTSLNIDLPWTTKVVLGLSKFMLANWPWMLAVAGLVGGVFVALERTVRPFRYAVHVVSLYIPILGMLNRKVQVAQLARILGTLTKSGITLVESLRIGAESVGNDVYRRVLVELGNAVQEGDSMAPHLAAYKSLFSPFIVQMINVGEETGKLDESLIFVSEFSEREVDDTTKTLTTVLEPLLMLIIGGIVGFVAIAIITPIYHLTGGIHA